MLLILAAILVGIGLGLALKGRLRALSEIHLRWWPLALAGLALQIVPVPAMEGSLERWLGVGLLVASYLVLLAFVVLNISQPGFALLGIGFALNALVISLNGGMPVSREALRVASGPAYPLAVRHLVEEGGQKHHLRREDDILTPLSDVIPAGPPVSQILSPGDGLALLGITWFIAGTMRKKNVEG